MKLKEKYQSVNIDTIENDSQIQFLGVQSFIDLLTDIKVAVFTNIKASANDVYDSFNSLRSDGDELDLYNVVNNSLNLYADGMSALVDE